jgi:hypothetical protein
MQSAKIEFAIKFYRLRGLIKEETHRERLGCNAERLNFRNAAFDGRKMTLWVDSVEKVVEIIVES